MTNSGTIRPSTLMSRLARIASPYSLRERFTVSRNQDVTRGSKGERSCSSSWRGQPPPPAAVPSGRQCPAPFGCRRAAAQERQTVLPSAPAAATAAGVATAFPAVDPVASPIIGSSLNNFKSINVCLKYNTIISICNIYTRKMKSPSVKRGD